MQRRVAVLYGLFALSGFCGLIYESIWSHYLKLFVGHAAHAQTIVLAVFMGGMGLGAWLTAKFTRRIGNLLWAYAAVEFVIGIAALGFHPLFGRITEWAYTTLLPATCAADGACASQWALATLLILPQSILLGTTFPLMTGGVLRLAPAMPGHKLALLYFLNSIGAVAGVLASGFVLIPWVGLPGTLMTAGLGNLALAIAVYFIGKPAAAGAGTEQVAGGEAPSRATPLLVTMLAVSLLTGLSSFIYEVAWIRMLSMVLGSATHSFEIMLASFILGLALGGLAIRKRIDRLADTVRVLALVQLAMGALALLTLPLYNHMFDAMAWVMAALSRNSAGYALFNLALTTIALAVMLPATFCAGMTLPLITYHLYRGGSGERAIGQVYAANTVGAIVGVLLAVHLLMPGLGLKHTMVVGGAIDIVLGWVLLRLRSRPAPRVPWKHQLAAGIALALVVAAPWAFHFDPLRQGSGVFRLGQARYSPKTEILHASDGKTATVHVARLPSGEMALSTNGKSDGAVQTWPGEPPTGDEATMTLLGALPIAYRPQATEAAVIGFGTGMSSATLLGSPHLQRLDTIEIEPAMVEAARHFKAVNERAYTDPRHRIVIDDAKSTFARSQRKYDVIVSEPSNPWVSGVSSLFTEEFYARVRAQLKPGGILAQWMHVYEITPGLLSSIFSALARSFPVYEVYLGGPADLIVIASAEGALPEPSGALFEMPAMRAQLGRILIDSTQRLVLHRVSDHRTLGPLLASYRASPNSDFFPIVDLYGPQARFEGASALPITLLHQATVPVLRALDGRPRVGFTGEVPAARVIPSRFIPYVRARQLAAFVQHGTLPPPDQSQIASDLAAAVLARNRLFTCQGQNLADAPWDGIVRLAADTLPYLDLAQATGLWQAARATPCAASLPNPQQRWLALFEHLAAARWAEAGPLAAALLAETAPPTALQRVMLVQVMVTAELLAGRPVEARRALDGELAKLPAAERGQDWVRLLAAHADRVAAARVAAR